ncbi:hypothetical protein ACFV5E_42725 [Streptomyces chartreusis]|uniref:hypothetical protein n=1 Tax=Streptomyces chartreusis TaxID=1969 RepID=UPI00368146EB
MTMEEPDRPFRHGSARQTHASPPGGIDPAGDALLANYLSQVNEAVARAITRQKTDDLLLRIRVMAARRAALESHYRGDDTLTNLVVRRDLPAQAKPAAALASLRQGSTRLRLAAGIHLTATTIALLPANAPGTASQMAIILAMTTAGLLTALMLWRRSFRIRPLPAAERPAGRAVPISPSSRRPAAATRALRKRSR